MFLKSAVRPESEPPRRNRGPLSEAVYSCAEEYFHGLPENISDLRFLSSAVRLHIFIAVRAGSFGNFAAFCPRLFGSAQAALTGAENCGIILQTNLPPGSKRMHRAFAAHR